MPKLILLTGLIPDSQRALVVENSVGSIQNAADALQRGFVNGLSQHADVALQVVNLPFVGSYPSRFKILNYPSTVDFIGRQKIFTLGFSNLAWVKHIARIKNSFKKLISLAKADEVVVVYSAHLPFLISALAVSAFRSKVKLCLILPDLPQFLGESRGVRGVVNGLGNLFFLKAIRHFDYFVVLTEQTISYLGLDKEKSVVIEGMSSETASSPELPSVYDREEEVNKLAILYTGTIDERYGIANLVAAFSMMKNEQAQLWVCGNGDFREKLEQAARSNSRIKYFGQIDRAEAVRLQASATVLVNPRSPVGEYTNYSFPSKVSEYFSSGRPTVMYRLPGIPDEYFDYSISPKDLTDIELASTLDSVLCWPPNELSRFGNLAKEFIREKKSSLAQTGKLVKLIQGSNP